MRRRIVPDAPRFRLQWLASAPRWPPEWLEDDDWVPDGHRALYTRVKNGLRVVLDNLDRDGTVLLPSYVPGGVAWAVLEAGFDVEYYPVQEDLSLPTAAIRERFEAVDPAVVVFIHYFGFVYDGFDDLRAAAHDAGALVVEDCARGLFSRDADGRLLGSTGDVAVFCLHKTLPAPNGGLVVARDGPLPEPTGRRSERMTAVRTACASALEVAGIRWSNTTPVLDAPRREPGSVAPEAPLQSPGGLSRRAIQRCDPAAVQSARSIRYRELREQLVDAGVNVVTPPAPAAAVPYGVAVLAESETARAEFYADVHRRRLPAQVLTWPPVHRHAAVNGLDGALALRRRLVVLPTHQQVPQTLIPDIADCAVDHFG